ncbi:MAG: ABC-F family ATP-binding cassette domain-containing protein [Lachnospiraceae bacterium]|nr:ABC-F family ATP-binding cassette domain-containing protein [Lachnospiraceae bacterium]
MILSCQNISKSFGEKDVLKKVTFHINDHEKVALIGNNGAGKTTLFHIITKELDADAGEISIKKDATIGYLSQHHDYTSTNTVYDELLVVKADVIRMEEQLRQMEEDMKHLTEENLDAHMKTYHDKMHAFDLAGGYTYKSDIQGILRGLQFKEEDFNKPVSTLSGGERTRLLLGRILLEKPDLILLDEPTNYLDIESVRWLENYLLNVKSAVLVVSHDRYFINKIVSKVVEIESGNSLCYEGNYEDFIAKKEVWLQSRLAAYENQQREIKHQEEVISKLRSFNREKSVKRADSRQKLLDRIERIDKPTEEKADMQFTLSPAITSGNDVLSVEGLAKSYGDRTLFHNVSFEIKRGEHIALIGQNGTGKTNILKIINGLINADNGDVKLGTNVTIGYFDQQSRVLDENKTVFDEISDTYPKLTQTEIRNVLAAFLFTGDEVFQPIRSLSGGERGRVVLAKLMLSGANFLILDEPTNHLDMVSKEVLEEALNSYTGTVLYVSHDRYFINRTASRILHLDGCKVTSYQGDYDYFLEKSSQDTERSADYMSRSISGAGNNSSASGSVLSSADSVSALSNANEGSQTEAKLDWAKQKELQAAKRKRENQLAKTEKEIEELETKIAAIQEEMSKPEIASNSVKLQELCKECDAAQSRLDELYVLWEELSEE